MMLNRQRCDRRSHIASDCNLIVPHAFHLRHLSFCVQVAVLTIVFKALNCQFPFNTPYSPNFPTKKARRQASRFVVSIFWYASPFRLLQGRLSTRHDACWSQTRQGDDLSPRGFVRPVSCVHLLRSFYEPFGSGRFLREL